MVVVWKESWSCASWLGKVLPLNLDPVPKVDLDTTSARSPAVSSRMDAGQAGAGL